jgi:elongation factor 1 alpha-like protein
MAPLRLPISNVFKGVGSGIGVSGRLCGGVVQVGERLRILPGDETAIVKCACLPSLVCFLLTRDTVILEEENNAQWAAAGSNVTIYLTAVDPIHLSIGNVLCPPSDLVSLATVFTAQIIVFDIQVPITAGTSVRLDSMKHIWSNFFVSRSSFSIIRGMYQLPSQSSYRY